MAKPNQLSLPVPEQPQEQQGDPFKVDDFDRFDGQAFLNPQQILSRVRGPKTPDQAAESQPAEETGATERLTQTALVVTESDRDRKIRESNEALLNAYAFGDLNKEDLPPYLRAKI